MSSKEFNLSAFLSAGCIHGASIEESSFERTESITRSTEIRSLSEQSIEGEIDYRIRQLSYSSILLFHTCPRRFQLNRLRATKESEEDSKSTITFAFGHIVGEGIQLTLMDMKEDEIIWKLFLSWHTDLLAINELDHKSFWYAIFAVQKFWHLYNNEVFLNDYELVHYQGLPACELSFCINFPDGFRLRGFVDAVLQHKVSGKIIVLECKTTNSSTINPAIYKNSSQAIGYSVVLDHIFPDLSHYDVLYLTYQTKNKEYTPIPFTKSFLQRALWIRELLLDIETIKMYEDAEVYPMHGESCTTFGRDCEYLQTCALSTEYLTKPCTEEEIDKTDYQVIISLGDLLDSQLRKMDIGDKI